MVVHVKDTIKLGVYHDCIRSARVRAAKLDELVYC